jgi:hypothetical protein
MPLAGTMRYCMNTCEGPRLLPELGEAVNRPIIQVFIILKRLVIFLVYELQEVPHIIRRGILIYPEGWLPVTGPQGLHVGPDEWRRRIEGNQEQDRTGMAAGTDPRGGRLSQGNIWREREKIDARDIQSRTINSTESPKPSSVPGFFLSRGLRLL